VLGYLFKKNEVTKHRDELLIILTPHVMRSIASSDKDMLDQVGRFNKTLNKGNLDEIERQLFPDRTYTTEKKDTSWLQIPEEPGDKGSKGDKVDTSAGSNDDGPEIIQIELKPIRRPSATTESATSQPGESL
jgi:Flp pilus assembly secretin CpaC